MFVAIELDDSTRAAVAREQQMAWRLAANAPIKFVNPQQSHLTLAFLADVPAAHVDRVIAAMQAPIDGIGPFDVAFGGLGVFPPTGAPRVLWLGVVQGARDVVAVQRVVAGRLEALGMTLEDRDFHPHLTLGRWRQARPSDRPALTADARSTGAMRVERVTLFESRLSSEGPAHIARAHALLNIEP
jgi:2'-5' RNA ligase